MSYPITEITESYDWQEAFGFAAFSVNEINTLDRMEEGYNDGDPWLAVGTLKDGRYFFLSAWCDYTGWDCQAGGGSETADTLESLIRWHMGDDDRQRLGYTLPPETDGAPLPVVESPEPTP